MRFKMPFLLDPRIDFHDIETNPDYFDSFYRISHAVGEFQSFVKNGPQTPYDPLPLDKNIAEMIHTYIYFTKKVALRNITFMDAEHEMQQVMDELHKKYLIVHDDDNGIDKSDINSLV